MAEKRRRSFWGWLLPKLLIFVLGVGAGWYVRDQQAEDLQQAYEQTRAELQELKRAGEQALQRGRRAGESLREGAKAAADSTKSALDEIRGNEEGGGG